CPIIRLFVSSLTAAVAGSCLSERTLFDFEWSLKPILWNLAGAQGLSSAKRASTRTALPFASPGAAVRKGNDASAGRHRLSERRAAADYRLPSSGAASRI